jgi:hypothetical protein
VQLVWLPTVIIPTPSDGVKRQCTDCEGAEAENEVSYQHFFNIVFQRFVYKNVQQNYFCTDNKIEGNQEKN